MWVGAYLILAIGLVAVAGWALQRFRPSAFRRYPGGIEEFKRRGKIVLPIYLAAALIWGGLMSGIPVLFVSALAVMFCSPVVAIYLFARWSRPRKRSPAEMQKAIELGQHQRAAQREQLWQQQLKQLVFPYELVSGAEAEAAYEAARAKGQDEGYTPLIITPATWLLPNFSREQLVKKAQRVIDDAPQAKEFFSERMVERSRYDEDGTTKRRLDEAEAFAAAEPIGPTRDLDNRMFTLRDTLGAKPPFPDVREAALVRIPTPRSWEIPAYTLYGRWNACPTSGQMVAVARHWHEKYGADICALGDGTLEFRVERPPTDLREALELSREQMLFCDEGMDDLIGAPDIFRDAVSLLPIQKYWIFWWD